MASLNKNIQTGNFIPGSEEYTHPEEIAIMGKYLRAGIKELNESIDLSDTLGGTVFGVSNKAKLKDIKSLPGDETLSEIDNGAGEVRTLSRLYETLKKSNNELDFSEELEKINIKNQKILSEDSFNSGAFDTIPKQRKELLLDNDSEKIRKNSPINLSERKDTILSNESGDLDVVDSRLYEKLYKENPRNDKRIIPDSENKDPKFKNLDTLLGGVHYDKYSSDTLSRSTTPTKDALEAANTGSSDVIFVRPEYIEGKDISLSGDSEKLLSKKEELQLDKDSSKLLKDNKNLELDKESEGLQKDSKDLKLSDYQEDLLKKDDSLELDTTWETFTGKKEVPLSKYLEKNPGEYKKPELSEYLDKKEKGDEVNLDNTKESLNSELRKLALSKYVDKLLDNEIEDLSNQREDLPEELKKIVLIDYLSGTIKDERELKLAIDSLQDMPGEKVNAILDDFINVLNADLKKIAKQNKKYFALGKEISSKNLLEDIHKNLSIIFNSTFIDELDIPESIHDLGKDFKIMPKNSGESKKFEEALSNVYGISPLTAEELRRTLDELTNYGENWAKKVSAYLHSILGKYKNFKKYIDVEDLENFTKIINGAKAVGGDYKPFNWDNKHNVDKEELIKKTLNYLKDLMKDRIKCLEEIKIPKETLRKLIQTRMSYGLSIGRQEYGNPITFKGAFENIKTEIIDNTWSAIKGWLTSTLNGSLFGAAANLLTDKAKLPGHDYSYDSTIRNIPNIVSFYDKKTKTTSFSGTPHSTPMEVGSVDMNTSGWFTRAFSKNREYVFKDNYLLAEGVQKTLRDLCNTEISQISSVEDLYDVLKNTEGTTAHARSSEGVMNGMTLSSNHVWEITIEPYISRFNGRRTWLPFMQELNRYNYQMHGVRTIYDKWIPITSFELQDKRLINKTLGLYAGEISYPVAMEYSNELRITIADDSFKSFKYYFDKVAEVSTYESLINVEGDKSNAIIDANSAKNRKFNKFYFKKGDSGTTYNSTFETINKNRFAVGMYKNLCFNICIYILTPQYSTIKKYNLLCVMRDYSIEYTGEVDSSPADVSVTFSIVGEIDEMREYDKEREDELYYSSQEILSAQIMNDIKNSIDADYWIDKSYESIMSKQQEPLSTIDWQKQDYLEDDILLGMSMDGNSDRSYGYKWNPFNSTETRSY